MNALLELQRPFDARPGSGSGGPARIPTGKRVTTAKLLSLADELHQTLDAWPKDSIIGDYILIEAHYRDVVAKSNRVMRLLRQAPDTPVNSSVVGARFEKGDDGLPHHVITYCVPSGTIEDTIDLLHRYAKYLLEDARFAGTIDSAALDLFNKSKQNMPDGLYKTEFAQIVKDSYYVHAFSLPQTPVDDSTGSFITLFDTGILTAEQLLTKLELSPTDYQLIDKLTFIANTETVINRIRRTAPYLIAMSATVGDFAQEPRFQPHPSSRQAPLIPAPSNEPTIGVIDTGFDETSYFAEWVTYDDRLKELDMTEKDMQHGTEITSIIVDGPALNPWLDDGCGRFRVKHFAIARDTANSALTIMEQIDEIVRDNLNIKVWNLSLGTDTQIPENFVSPIAALLDTLQFEYDVIFIVAGTNLPKGTPPRTHMRIGSPADSINSLVVNACDSTGSAADYSRRGPVLEFFHKPDIAYYGGDKDIPMRAWSTQGIVKDTGTSLAAPWITRKIAYLIYVMGFSRQTAKALLIDAAATWSMHDEDSWRTLGFGVPPIRIEDILETPNNEIRFIVSGISELYETYQIQLPVPIDNKGKHPFMARATLCYCPQCDRHQGVDYTKTELDLHFGRVKPPSAKKLKKNPDAKSTIESVNGNTQAGSQQINLPEGAARPRYRKWDNVKHISDIEKNRFAARKTYTPQGFWGISLLAKERWERKAEDGPRSLPFSVVVTLREMEGRNRIEDFKRECMAWGWRVDAITIENRVDIYNEGEQEIDFE